VAEEKKDQQVIVNKQAELSEQDLDQASGGHHENPAADRPRPDIITPPR